jgi:hypothetical protein
LAQLRQHENQLATLDICVSVVTFDSSPLARAYVESTKLTWPLLLDTDRTLYRAYGMTRGGWWSIYGPASIWRYLKLMSGGRQPGKPGSDWRQLGGDVLIDPAGIVRAHHISTSPHDRPSIDAMLQIIGQADQARSN